MSWGRKPEDFFNPGLRAVMCEACPEKEECKIYRAFMPTRQQHTAATAPHKGG